MMAKFDIPPEDREDWEQHSLEGRLKREARRPDVMANHPRSHCRWNSREKEDLRAAYESGVPIDELVRLHGRRVRAIEIRLEELGFVLVTGQAHVDGSGCTIGDERIVSGGEAEQDRPDGTIWSESRPGWLEHDDAALQRWRTQRPRVLEQHRRAHCPWSDAEDEQLLAAYEHGASIEALEGFHSRQASAIRSRLRIAIADRMGQRRLDDELVGEGIESLDRHPQQVQQALQDELGRQNSTERAWLPWSSREDFILRHLLAEGVSELDATGRLGRSLSEVVARVVLLKFGHVTAGTTEAGTVWSEQDDADLFRLATASYSAQTLAAWFGRTESAIAARLVSLQWNGPDSGGGATPVARPHPTSLTGGVAGEAGEPVEGGTTNEDQATSEDQPRGRSPTEGEVTAAAPPTDFGLQLQQHLHCPRPGCGEEEELEVITRTEEGTAYSCLVCAASWVRPLTRACPSCASKGVPHTTEAWENKNYDSFRDFNEQRHEPKDYHRVGRTIWWCDKCHARFE